LDSYGILCFFGEGGGLEIWLILYLSVGYEPSWLFLLIFY